MDAFSAENLARYTHIIPGRFDATEPDATVTPTLCVDDIMVMVAGGPGSTPWSSPRSGPRARSPSPLRLNLRTNVRSRPRIYVPARGVADWAALLADPSLRWKEGNSAERLARTWQKVADRRTPTSGY